MFKKLLNKKTAPRIGCLEGRSLHIKLISRRNALTVRVSIYNALTYSITKVVMTSLLRWHGYVNGPDVKGRHRSVDYDV